MLFEDTSPVSIPVTAGSKTWVYGSSLAGIGGSNPVGGTGVFLVSVVCRQEEVLIALPKGSYRLRCVNLSVTVKPR